MKNIVLIGMMGCGKTTISQLLSKQLKRPLIDIDEYLVDKYKMTIPEMFNISEAYFRERETICCMEVGQKEGYIISTGGGVIKNQKNIDALHHHGTLIYLDRPVENILSDVEISTRPLLKDGPQKLYELYQQRHELYLQACDYHVINDKSLEDVVNNIIHLCTAE
ncbi:shikimate kinase [Candidatus Stoquefichus massiliensis]|uniref:shikimate kinase n=1 Tax=Candidatus Stoquefichus massiliensis TaxID=1470350 RepID=UPI00048A0AE3|nr:shikimate kinase [Candidatus Stoquefichus massiliensis]